MDDNNEQNLDSEYKRYLEIMRPYLGQLLDQDVIEICNAWIQRLSSCKDHEKSLRNKYVFAMCYQLAKGVLEEPFLKDPSTDDLSPLSDDINSDESLSESEYNIIDLENGQTQVLFSNEKSSLSIAEYLSRDSDNSNTNKIESLARSSKSINSLTYNIPEPVHKQNIMCYNCCTDIPKFNNNNEIHQSYNFRANNLVMKLREIKTQNFMLHRELNALREELRMRSELDCRKNEILMVNNSTSTNTISQESTTTLKCKLQEVKESRNTLLEKISNLQDNIDNFDYIKKYEIDDLETKHKLEIIDIKTSVRQETEAYYENKLEDLKRKYEESINDIKTNHLKEIEKMVTIKDELISDKDKTILSKDAEIERLNNDIEELKKHQSFIFNKFSDFPKEDVCTSENFRQKAEDLQKCLNKMEKSKLKSLRAYEIKLANVQKEKHLTECSFHLELIRQRAQVMQEISNEYQTELTTALTKLETKYKEIIANLQSTAVQRRIQDQMALESIIQAVCGARNEGMYTNSAQATCPSQLTNKAMRNQTRDCNGSCDNEMPTLFQGNKVGSIIVGNKSFGEESAVNDYCLDSEKLGELFEKMYIPQRDTGGESAKK